MSTDTTQKLQDELVGLLAPDLSTASVALVKAWQAQAAAASVSARCVVTANIATLGGAGSFAGVSGGSTTNSDGVTCVAGDTVLLVAQTTAAQNGLYTVGAVAAGTAPLTRHVLFPTGNVMPYTQAVLVGGEGTVFKNTTWRSFISGVSTVINTTDPKFYPLTVTWSAALVAGIMIGGASATSGAPAVMPVFSTSSACYAVRTTANTCSATDGGYQQIVAPTAGVCGTGAINVQASVKAGTINVADISTLTFTLVNQI